MFECLFEEVVFSEWFRGNWLIRSRFGVNVFSEEVDSFDFSKSYQYVPTYHILNVDCDGDLDSTEAFSERAAS